MSEHDDDILLWSEHQAELLCRLATARPVNAESDWPNIVEEIESVGNDQLHAVESFLVQALLHDFEAEAWPEARDAPHWRAEARPFRGCATSQFAPSVGQRIDLARVCEQGPHAIPETIDGQVPLAIRSTMPTLDKLLAES